MNIAKATQQIISYNSRYVSPGTGQIVAIVYRVQVIQFMLMWVEVNARFAHQMFE